MAIVDRPMRAPGPSAIQPYLAQGAARSGRSTWEDELDKLLLGIPQSEWGGIRQSLGLSAGGGFAPGGGMSSAGGGSGPAPAAMSAPATLSVGSAPTGTLGGDGGETGHVARPSPNQTLGGLVDALGNVVLMAMNPVWGVAGGIYNAVTNPRSTSLSPFGSLSSMLGLNTGDAMPSGATALGPAGDRGLDAMAGALAGAIGQSQPTGLGLAGQFGAGFSPEVQAAVDSAGYGGPVGEAQSQADAAAASAEASAPGSDGFGGNSMAWMGGGYTGDGAPNQPAGTVHKGEFVINAAAVDALPPAILMLLGALNDAGRTGAEGGGYQAGGYVQPDIGNRWQRTRDRVEVAGGGHRPFEPSSSPLDGALMLLGLSPLAPVNMAAAGGMAIRDAFAGNSDAAFGNILNMLPGIRALGAARLRGGSQAPDVLYKLDEPNPTPDAPQSANAGPSPGGQLASQGPFRDVDGHTPANTTRVSGLQPDGSSRPLTAEQVQALAQESAGAVVVDPSRVPARASGIYEMPPQYLRGDGDATLRHGRIVTKRDGDLSTLSHEAGHAFEVASRGSRIAIPQTLMKEFERRYPVGGSRGESNPTLKSRKREAWAMMFEKYVTEGQAFRDRHPEIGAWMRKTIRANPALASRITLNSAAALALGMAEGEE